MENYFVEGDFKNPTFDFNATEGVIEIRGRSWPEDVIDIYEDANKWIANYFSTKNPKTIIRIKLDYFNTSSSKAIIAILKKAEEYSKLGNDVAIEWYYEDDDVELQEEGETFQKMINLPFQLIEVESID